MDIIPLAQFEDVLRDELELIRKETGKGKASWSDLLAYYVARNFLQLEGHYLLQSCAVQGAGEEGIDMFWVEKGGKRVIIGQAEAGSDLKMQRSFSRNIISKLRRALCALNDSEGVGGSHRPIADAIESYSEAVSDGYTVEFWAIIAGHANRGLDREGKLFSSVDLSDYPKHSYKLIDAGRLLTEYCARVDKLPYPEVELTIKKGEFFKHGQNGLLATVVGQTLAQAVEVSGLTIFESNARLPLLRSNVNPEIVATLEGAEDRPHFWDFNNGLTILCDEFFLKGERLRICGAQIVNGCQTASTLSKHANALAGVDLVCRVIQHAPAGLAEKIRRATNLQNAITDRDLRSGDKVQKTLQMAFRQRRYFYERKRDEYRNIETELGTSNMRARFPKGEIGNQYLAQLALAFWHQMPAESKMETKKIFVSSSGKGQRRSSVAGFYDKVFHQHVACEELLLPYLVFNYLYDRFDIGRRKQGSKRTKKYMLQTHGDFTVLTLVGKAMRNKYGLRLPLDASSKLFVSNRLIPRFENVEDHSDFFDRYDKGVKALLRVLTQWLERAVARQQKELGFSDVRSLFISGESLDGLLASHQISDALANFERKLPDLD